MPNKLRLALMVSATLALIGSSTAMAAGSGGVTGPAFYVDGQLYRTVGTPNDLSNTGGPAHSFDTIYEVSAYQDHNVSAVAPGMPGYNGGRWQVQVVTFTDYEAALATYDWNGSGDFDSNEEIEAAIAGGAATTSEGPSFTCPVIPLAQGASD